MSQPDSRARRAQPAEGSHPVSRIANYIRSLTQTRSRELNEEGRWVYGRWCRAPETGASVPYGEH